MGLKPQTISERNTVTGKRIGAPAHIFVNYVNGVKWNES